MDFLYRNMYMEQKKWEATTQITIEEDINVPDAKNDCMNILLKDAVIHVDETRVGREQVVVKGCLQYQILYTAGTTLEEICGTIPFEEVINATGATPGDMATTKAVLEDFKVSMINTRKLAVQSVIVLHVANYQQMEEAWTEDVVNCECGGVEKQWESKEMLQLVQKKSDVFRVKEEMDLPGGYPTIHKVLWKRVTLGEFEARPMEGRVSVKGDLACQVIYIGQGQNPSVKLFQKKVPFHGVVDCSGCSSDSYISIIPCLHQYTLDVKPDLDGEERLFYLDAPLDISLRVYEREQMRLLADAYSTQAHLTPEKKVVHAPMLYVTGEGKTKVRHSHVLKEGVPFMTQLLCTMGEIYPEKEVWEDGKLHLMGSVQVQMLYQTGEEEMPYAVTECMIPYNMEMESSMPWAEGMEKPSIMIEPRLEQLEVTQIDSRELEIKGVVGFFVLVFGSENSACIGNFQYAPMDAEVYASLPSMVVCFADQDTPLWEYGKKYYMSVEDMKRINNLSADVLKRGEKLLLVKGASYDNK